MSALIVALLTQACSSPYFGRTKEGWNNLTEEERMAVKKEYQAIIDARSEETHTDIINERTQSIIDYGVSKQQ